jgi:hypothetical protein
VGIEPRISTGCQGNEPARLLADVEIGEALSKKKLLSALDLE